MFNSDSFLTLFLHMITHGVVITFQLNLDGIIMHLQILIIKIEKYVKIFTFSEASFIEFIIFNDYIHSNFEIIFSKDKL